MEISNQAVNKLEFIAGIDESINPLFPGFYFFIPAKGFQGSGAGGADGNNPLAILPGLIQFFSRCSGYFSPFRMNLMLFNVFNPYWLKSAQTDMQGDKLKLYSLFF